MSIKQTILPDRLTVFTQFSGCITLNDIRDSHTRYTSDPAYSPGQTQIFDLERVTDIAMGYPQMTALVSMTYARYSALPMITHAALFAPHDLAFGMARMFELAFGDHPHYRILVTRSASEALDWTGYHGQDIDTLRALL